MHDISPVIYPLDEPSLPETPIWTIAVNRDGTKQKRRHQLDASSHGKAKTTTLLPKNGGAFTS